MLIFLPIPATGRGGEKSGNRSRCDWPSPHKSAISLLLLLLTGKSSVPLAEARLENVVDVDTHTTDAALVDLDLM